MDPNYKLVEFSWTVFVWQMLILASLIMWIYCLTNLIKSDCQGKDKIVWLLVIIFLPLVGSVLYLIFVKRNALIKD